jgi:tripartite-type tricarboxylate transporter receptor subunit TctC
MPHLLIAAFLETSERRCTDAESIALPHGTHMKPLAIAAFALILPAMPQAAQTYPDRPVAVVVPWAAGGAADINVRSFVEAMSRSLGQAMPVMNRTGASGTIGTVHLARSAPDGYTIGNVSVGPLTTQPVMKKQGYDIEAFDYICMHYSNPQFFVVPRDAPFDDVAQMQAWLRENPRKAMFGSTGIGSIPHVAGLALGKSIGVPLEHVSFKADGEIMVSALNGDLVGWLTQATFLRANRERIKAIGIMSENRLAEFPDVPTFREQKHDLVFDVWGGLAAPKGLEPTVLAKLEASCRTAYHSPAYEEVRRQLGMSPSFKTGKEFAEYIRHEAKKNDALLREAGLAE